MKRSEVKIEDIRSVCDSIDVVPTDDLILFVITELDNGLEQDPTATWNLVVENLIYQYLNLRDKELYE